MFETISGNNTSVCFERVSTLMGKCIYAYAWTESVNSFAVLSEGPGWGCIAENAEDAMDACVNTTMPANMIGVSDEDSCR